MTNKSTLIPWILCACKHTQEVFAVRGSFPKLNADQFIPFLRLWAKLHHLNCPNLLSQICVKHIYGQQLCYFIGYLWRHDDIMGHIERCLRRVQSGLQSPWSSSGCPQPQSESRPPDSVRSQQLSDLPVSACRPLRPPPAEHKEQLISMCRSEITHCFHDYHNTERCKSTIKTTPWYPLGNERKQRMVVLAIISVLFGPMLSSPVNIALWEGLAASKQVL